MQLTALQANHKETVDQLNEKTKLAAQMKTDIANLAQQNQSMAEEVGVGVGVGVAVEVNVCAYGCGCV